MVEMEQRECWQVEVVSLKTECECDQQSRKVVSGETRSSGRNNMKRLLTGNGKMQNYRHLLAQVAGNKK